MNVQEIMKNVAFSDVMRELIITDFRSRSKMDSYIIFFSHLKQMPIPVGVEKRPLVIDRLEFHQCFFSVGDSVSLKDADYLSAEFEEWETKNLDPALLVASVLYTLTCGGKVFTEEEREKVLEDSIKYRSVV